MSIEQNLKTLIGEYVIQICMLQEQLVQANTKIEELTPKDKEKK